MITNSVDSRWTKTVSIFFFCRTKWNFSY